MRDAALKRNSQQGVSVSPAAWSVSSKTRSYIGARIFVGPQPNSSFPYTPCSNECYYQFASFYYELTAATSEAQLGAILKLVPVPQLVMGLDLPFMPNSTFAPAIADIGRGLAFN